jgi:type II secretory pathway component PulF
MMADEPIKLSYQTAHLPTDPGWRAVPRSVPRQVFAWVVSNAFWMTMAAILIGAPATAAGSVGGPAFSAGVLLTIILMVPMFAFAADRARRRRLTAALGYLQQAIRLNLPLHRILSAAERSESGRLRKELFLLRASLEAGEPLAAALTKAFPAMPPRTAGLIEYAEHIGRLPQTMDRLIHEELRESRSGREDDVLMKWYPPLLLLVTNGVLGIVGIFAVPKLEGIFRDFHLKVPQITHVVLRIQDGLALPLAAMILVLWPIWAVRLRESMRPRRSRRLFAGVRDRILWSIPVCRGILRERAIADVCGVVADALELGFPLDQSLDRLEGLELNLAMRRRMQKWNDGLARGLLPDEAARAAELPRFFVGMLATARANGELPDVLRFVARFYQERFVLHRELLRAAYLPAVTFIMGIIVACVGLGLLLPMARLAASMGTATRGGL